MLRTVSSEVLRVSVFPNRAFSTVARSLCWTPWSAVFVGAFEILWTDYTPDILRCQDKILQYFSVLMR